MTVLNPELATAAERLQTMANGFQAARILSLGVEVGIFERLGKGPCSAVELARELSLDARGTEESCSTL